MGGNPAPVAVVMILVSSEKFVGSFSRKSRGMNRLRPERVISGVSCLDVQGCCVYFFLQLISSEMSWFLGRVMVCTSLKSLMALRLNLGQQFDLSKIMEGLNSYSCYIKSFDPFKRVPLL
jgi:hypothetical protein